MAWDFGPASQSSSSLSGPKGKSYHTNKSKEIRLLLSLLQIQSTGVATAEAKAAASIFEKCNEGKHLTMLLHTSTGSLSPCAMQLLDLLKDSHSFDVIRDVRRTSCLQSLISLPESSTIFEGNNQNIAETQNQYTITVVGSDNTLVE